MVLLPLGQRHQRGNYELPMGVTLRELIFDPELGGGIPNGRS